MKTTNKNSIVTEIIINAPAAVVWRLLTDLPSFEKWNPFIVKSTGEVKPKSKLVNTLRTSNSKVTFKPIVQSVIPNQYFDWVGNLFFPGVFDGHHYFKIDQVSENQVKLTHGENFTGIFASMIFRKIGNDTRAGFIRMNQAIKSEAENNN
jgi:hypothetical protein